MSQKNIFDVFPTPMARQQMKNLRNSAEKGYSLLKRKVEALQFKYRKIGREIVEIKKIMGQIMKDASYLLAEAKYIVGDLNTDILNRVGQARLKVRQKVENIAGVRLRIFECYEAGEDQYELAGLAKGGLKITQLKKAYGDATEILVQLATLQTAFITLEEVIRSTNRRVNSLKYRYIPKVDNTYNYIVTELDEKAREEFFRIKKIKKKKEKEENARKEILESLGCSEESPVKNILVVYQDTAEATQQDTMKAPRQGTKKVPQKDAGKVSQQKTTKATEKDPDKTSEQHADKASEQDPDKPSKQDPDKSSEQDPEKATEEVPEKASEQCAEKASEPDSEKTSVQDPEKDSKQDLEKASEQIPKTSE